MPDNKPSTIPFIFKDEEENLRRVSDGFEGGQRVLIGKKSDQYKILRYPQELGAESVDAASLKNYVVFYINMRKRDTTGQYEKKIGTTEVDLTGENRMKVDNASDLAPVAVAGGISALGNFFGNSLVAGLAVGAGAAAIGSSDTLSGLAKDLANTAIKEITSASSDGNNLQFVQLQKVIALHINSRPSTTHEARYDDVQLGALSGLIRQGQSGTNVIQKFQDIQYVNGMDAFTQSAGDVLRSGAPIIGALGFKNLQSADVFGLGPAGENIGKALGVTTNPFIEQIFRSMGPRKFSFDYVFLPKSKDEAMIVRDIVNTFKYYMHPHMDVSNPYWLTYPAEFQIKYFYNGEENSYVHKISSCVLTGLTADFGSDNDFMTFKPNEDDGSRGGYPTEISLKLQFTELELLTRERIGQGY